MKFNNVFEFINWVESQKRFSKKEDLSKMNYLMHLFNHPEQKFKSIHITGTNGKGSTVAMLRAILRDKGLNVATFTSPYITVFNERIGYNNQNISDEDLLKYANQILAKYDLIVQDGYELPTFFEFITLLAFIYFADIPNLDIALIEVGMGGKLDCTNVITPVLSIITNVALDHMHILGNTQEEILIQKLGIVKPNIPLVYNLKDIKLINIVKDYAKNFNACTYNVNYDDLKIIKFNDDYSLFDYQEYLNIKLNLLGLHQIENACLVIEAFKIIKEQFNLTNDNLYNGLQKTFWQGRLEILSKNPYILVDGGHNIDGISRVCEFVKSLNYKYKRAVISISDDKEKEQMIKILDQTFDEIIFTKYTYSRSASLDELYQISNCQNKIKCSTVNESIDYVYNHHCPFTLFLGSLYLVSEVRNIINKKVF